MRCRSVSGPTGSSAWAPARSEIWVGPVPSVTASMGRFCSEAPRLWYWASCGLSSQAVMMCGRTSSAVRKRGAMMGRVSVSMEVL